MTRILEMWKTFVENTGNKDIVDHMLVGNVVTEDLVDHIRDHMPLKTDKPSYV